MAFYTGTGSRLISRRRVSAASGPHGSWNGAKRTGYEVALVPVKDGKPTGATRFHDGFVADDGDGVGAARRQRRGGRMAPPSATTAPTVWRIAYGGEHRAAQ